MNPILNKSRLAVLSLALTGLLTTSFAFASQTTGRIISLRFNSGTSPARVSVQLENLVNSCGTGHYAYESADVGLGKIWTDALLFAQAHDREVVVVGTGQCDVFAIEGIASIDVL